MEDILEGVLHNVFFMLWSPLYLCTALSSLPNTTSRICQMFVLLKITVLSRSPAGACLLARGWRGGLWAKFSL